MNPEVHVAPPAPPKPPNHNALHSYTEGTFQNLQKFFANNTSKTRFLHTLYQFLRHKDEGKVFNQVPMLGGNFVDFFNLYRTTERHGGYEVVTKRRLWATVARELNILNYMDGACNPLRKWYEKFLKSFEEVIRIKVAKHNSEKSAAAAAAGRNTALTTASSHPPTSTTTSNQTHPAHQSQASLKRPRTEPPPAVSAPVAQNTTPFIPRHDPTRIPAKVSIEKTFVDMAVKNIQSKNLVDVVKGLNYLNQASMEPDQIQLNANRTPFYVDKHPLLVVALGELLDEANPFVNLMFPIPDYTNAVLERNDQYHWDIQNPVEKYDHIQVACFKNLENNALYLSTLNVIRNITFEASNVQLVSYSATIIRHVIAILLISSPSSCTMPETTSYALDILLHIGSFIDITGTRRIKKTLSEIWVSNPFDNEGVERDLLVLTTTPAFSTTSKDAYTQATSHLFPVLLQWLRISDRDIVLKVIRILGRLASVPENALSLDIMCPDEDLGYLVQLLCVSDTTAESLDTVSFGRGSPHMRLTPLQKNVKLNAAVTEDFNELCDIQIRDAVLETLVVFVSFYSATLKERIAAQSQCIHLIARIILRSCNKPKNEYFSKDAITLLASLSSEPRNRKKILPVISALTTAALSDESIAELMSSQSMRAMMQPQLPPAAVGGTST